MLLQEALQQVLQHLDEHGVKAALLVHAALEVDVGASTLVKAVRAGHLVALKLLAHDAESRPQDGLDLRALRDALSDEELVLAKEACALIEARGYAPGRELSTLLEQLIRPAG